MELNRRRPKKRYPLLISAGIGLLLFAALFYTVANPNPAVPVQQNLAEYFALVGGGAALVLGGIADISIYDWGVYLETLILENRQNNPQPNRDENRP
jgi:hypothetical protein